MDDFFLWLLYTTLFMGTVLLIAGIGWLGKRLGSLVDRLLAAWADHD